MSAVRVLFPSEESTLSAVRVSFPSEESTLSAVRVLFPSEESIMSAVRVLFPSEGSILSAVRVLFSKKDCVSFIYSESLNLYFFSFSLKRTERAYEASVQVRIRGALASHTRARAKKIQQNYTFVDQES